MKHYIAKRRNPFQVYSLILVNCYEIQLKSPIRLINIFIDIGPSLANRIDSNRHFRDYLRTPSVNQLTVRSIDENKISQVIEHLKNKSSSGVDGISNNLIKMARCELIKPLTKIINQMLHTGIFPEQLKISKVLPLHKANPSPKFSNVYFLNN